MSGRPAPPQIGVGVPMVGPHAGPEAIALVATAADRLGFHSVTVSERLLLPAHEGWTNDFGLPEHPAYDAIETLTWIAAKTTHLRLRSAVVVPLFQQPVILARRLATLDHLSGGRLDAGVGLGWMPEEYAASAAPVARRVTAFEESIAAMRACWGPDPVRYEGSVYRIPPAKIGPKPHNGCIPIFVGGVAKPAIERAARIGDGLTLAFRSWDATHEQIDWYRAAGGIGPITVKGGPMLADAEHATAPSTWTEASIVDDLARLAESGVEEFAWDLNVVGYAPQRQVEALARLATDLGLPPRATVR